MKIKLLTLFIGFSALFTSTLRAQITIDSTHIAQIGVSYFEVTDTNTVYMPGPAGPNQTWSFTNVNAHSFVGNSFVDPATTPSGASFPSSNVAMDDGSGTYVYTNHNPNDLRIVGVSIFGYDVNAIPNEKTMVFPSSYNTSFTDTMSGSITIPGSAVGAPFDSIRVKNTKYKHVVTDAWGNISTPEGAFASIRFYERALAKDSTWGKMFGIWTLIANTSDSSHMYTWWTNDALIGVPLVTLDYNKDLNETTSIKWYSSSPPCLNPDIQAGNLNFPTVTDTTIGLNWTNGNGSARIVLASEDPIVDFPEVGNTYTANPEFGTPSTAIGNSFVVYNGTGSSVTVTGLTPGATYYFAVTEHACTPERYSSEMPITGDETTTMDVGVNSLASKSQSVSVYPNPVTQGQPVILSQKSDIRVFNSLGKEIITEKNVDIIHTSSMSPGFYIIVTGNNQRLKVVVD
ncbi:MAG: T9SS type A sorting domain-containing protein [Bacteroidota bacterium]|nr:T9SS type A sorting domain-containing protein [Bacteroidota bacterium]